LSYLNGELRTLETAARLLAARWDASWDAIVEVVPLQHLQRAFEVRRDSPWCKTLVDLR
jgi:phage-related minor tail protein